jgi:predicted permease
MNFAVDPVEIGMNPEQTRELARNILTGLHQIAGVEYASHAGAVPLGYFGQGDRLIIDGTPTPTNPSDTDADYNVVSPEYFSVMGIKLLGGRSFTDADNVHGRDVAVVSESAAKKFWPGQNAIGRTFRLAGEKVRKLEVVGISNDAEFQMFNGGKTRPYFYVPFEQHLKGNSLMVFQVRTKVNPLSIRPAVEKIIHSLAPQLPIFMVQTMREALYTLNGLLLFQVAAKLAALIGGLGLTLAIIGLYGVASFAVSRRVHEIGLRMALGATRGSVFRMIYRHSFIIVGAGLGIGVAIALLVARAFGALVVVDVWDPMTYLLVCAVLALSALASCFFPARHAMGIEPMRALRED